MDNRQPSLTTKNAESENGMSSDCANLHADEVLKTSHSHADRNQMGEGIIPEIKPFHVGQEAQTDTFSKRPPMCEDLLKAATNGDRKTLTQLLGLDGGEIPDSALVTIDGEASNNTLIQTKNLQSATAMGNTVLHILASNGFAELALKIYEKDEFLLEVCNMKQETPLHRAARFGYTDVITKIFDKARAKEHDLKNTLRKKNSHEETALHEAARYGHVPVVEVLMKYDPELAGEVKKNGESPLYLATAEGHVRVVRSIVQHLLDSKITLTSKYYSGPNKATALHVAVLRNYDGLEEYIRSAFLVLRPWKLIKLMLRKKIKLSEVMKDVKQLFMVLQRQETIGIDMVQELLNLKDENLAKSTDNFDSTALHYAASTGDGRMVQKLLEGDASLAYCPDSCGLFPLHVASYLGNTRTVVTLMENNLDSWELEDNRGRNFLHVGAENHTNIIFELIEMAGKTTVPKLQEFLIKRISARDSLHYPKLQEVLIKAISARDYEGNTPLHIEARCECRPLVKALLQKEWVGVTLTSLDNLFFSDHHSETQVNKTTSESYEKTYQHYENLYLRGKAGKSPQKSLDCYIDEQEPTESFEILASKVQTIGLGSVLIATVTFAAAFTLPGGYNSNDGTPVLGRNYVFRAFILANLVAFGSSFISTSILIYLGATQVSASSLKKKLDRPQYYFQVAATSMVLAFGLGLYVVLSPVSKRFSILVLVMALLTLPFRMDRRKWITWLNCCTAPFLLVFLFALIK
ncbi:Ankyrin repeat protein family-like protein [Rhynchospora pubera]|uniref:Ankyrin repeat protein family-like protein n=1 Tax=Rhynchospora pubera TaxID=906938 RepID=A0AAV8CZK6_9POAL|nr:Ankyrin repeat protein family-like protein [Rhynchospora pubera]